MTYHIARNGHVFGPYTLEQVQQYMASGNIVASDLAQAEGSTEWLPVAQVFPLASVAEPPMYAGGLHPGGLPTLFPNPPDLPWWVALLLGLVTGGLFFVAWDLVEAAWMRRIDKNSNALWLYIAVAVVYVFRLPSIWNSVSYNVFDGSQVPVHHGSLFGLAGLVLFIASRFIFRGELLRHFNGPEPVGLHLNAFLTLLFGGLYFQYKFNEINRIKRMLHVSVPPA